MVCFTMPVLSQLIKRLFERNISIVIGIRFLLLIDLYIGSDRRLSFQFTPNHISQMMA